MNEYGAILIFFCILSIQLLIGYLFAAKEKRIYYFLTQAGKGKSLLVKHIEAMFFKKTETQKNVKFHKDNNNKLDNLFRNIQNQIKDLEKMNNETIDEKSVAAKKRQKNAA